MDEVLNGFASGLPYVAVKAAENQVANFHLIEGLLNKLPKNSKVLIDLKNGYIFLRYAKTRKQRKIIKKCMFK